MSIIIIKNSGAAGINISDLGIDIPALGQREFVGPNGLFSKIDVFESLDLKNLIQSGDLIVNNGIEDLSNIEGISSVMIESQYEDQTNVLPPNLEVDYISSEGTNSTSKNQYQTKLRLATDDLEVGDYLIQWTYEVKGDNTGRSRVILNETDELGYNFYTKKILNYVMVSGFIKIDSFSGINNIDIDWRAENKKVFKIRRARLMLWRIH